MFHFVFVLCITCTFIIWKRNLISKEHLFNIISSLVAVWILVFAIVISEEQRIELLRIQYISKVENIRIDKLETYKDYDGTVKNFILAKSGRAKENIKYRVRLIKGDKKRIYDDMDATKVELVEYENSSETPHIEVVWEIMTYDGKEVPIDNCDIDFIGYSDTEGRIKGISIHVPKGF